jgi:hypothetical protein
MKPDLDSLSPTRFSWRCGSGIAGIIGRFCRLVGRYDKSLQFPEPGGIMPALLRPSGPDDSMTPSPRSRPPGLFGLLVGFDVVIGFLGRFSSAIVACELLKDSRTFPECGHSPAESSALHGKGFFMKPCIRWLSLAIVVALACSPAIVAVAATDSWKDDSASWSDPSNWNPFEYQALGIPSTSSISTA